jgi:DnaJ-class molecular chaperone
MQNLYQTLGVNKDANADEIKQAYRRLASQHHPDRGGDTARFQEIQKAYEVLGNDQKRAAYDNPMSRQGGVNFGGGSGSFDFESIFDIFGARFQHPQQQRQKQRAMMTLWITLRDVVQGGRRTVSVGTHSGTQAIEIDIPLAINDGDSVQYPGIGPGGMDLIITYRTHPDPKWTRHGLTLQTEHAVSVWDLVLGCETVVKDIAGNNLSITVPASTQPGSTLRLRGRGIVPKTGVAGDLMVTIQAQIPDNTPQELLDHIAKLYRP